MPVRWTSSPSILADLAVHWAYLQGAWTEAQAAPLSRRKALLVAALVDSYADRLFAGQDAPGDILVFRSDLAARSAPLALVFGLVARLDAVVPVTEFVAVPLETYGQLRVEDFMVSLYNGNSIQRQFLALPNGERLDLLETLALAIADLGAD